MTAGAECIPFPYVKGAFGMVVVILETIDVRHFISLAKHDSHLGSQKVRKNRDDLKDLCDSIMEISGIIQGQLSSHESVATVQFKGLCEQFDR
jgi:hypothetical protein